MKSVALAIGSLPLGGCAIAVGQLFSAFIRAVAYNPEIEDSLFSHSMLGFALIETFMVVIIIIEGAVYAI